MKNSSKKNLSNIRVLIGSVGRFHSEYILEAFINRNILSKLISTSPSSKYKKKNLSFIKNFLSIGYIIYIRRFLNNYLSYLLNIFGNILFSFRLNKFIKKNNFNIFIIFSSNALSTFKLLDNNKKIIKILERGSTHYLHQLNLMNLLFKQNGFRYPSDKYFLNKELKEYSLADYIVVPTNYVKKTFISNQISSSKLIVNPYGADLDIFKPLTNLKKLNNGFINCVFCGDASLRKGFHDLINFCDTYKKDKILFHHIGPISKEIKFLLKHNQNHNNLKFYGSLNQSDINELFNKFDMLVLPSYEEGMSMVQLQAISSGIPIVSTEESGFIEIQNQSNIKIGEKCYSGSNESLYRAIMSVKENNIIRNFVNEELTHIRNTYTWKNYQERYVNFISEIYKN